MLGEHSWTELLAGADDVVHPPSSAEPAPRPTSPDDPALVIFSSGTTSEPKGMLHGHRSPTLQFWLQADIFGRHAGTRMFSAAAAVLDRRAEHGDGLDPGRAVAAG